MGDRSLSASFRKFLSPAFVKALHELVESPQGQWWRDVLAHTDLVLAVRHDSLNVYHRGGSIFRVVLQDGRVVPETHFKYLVRQRQGLAAMAADGTFVHDRSEALWSSYEGRTTLNEMIAAARSLAGPEKTGLHALIKTTPRVIDVEVAFRSVANSAEEPASSDDIHVLAEPDDATAEADKPVHDDGGLHQDRLDAVTLEDRDGQLWVVFHEAKHFANAELRAGQNRPPQVSKQIARYRRSIEHHAAEIKSSYRDVCQALSALHSMHLKVQSSGPAPAGLDPLIARAAEGETLHVDIEPRLIVFGFDKDQKEGSIWQRHRERLTKEFGLTVYAIGNPSTGGPAAFARRAS